ncbi:hypothetical protein RJ640_012235 [Escallonia rubra]|uniref:Uncharacterized protein n=1 Tax=Escallonia rubra TaxID=112253 RepID=A0AA88QLH3_9ASTE|nr:hypothetical protein RJ640_012235 [Escallonia rubra]
MSPSCEDADTDPGYKLMTFQSQDKNTKLLTDAEYATHLNTDYTPIGTFSGPLAPHLVLHRKKKEQLQLRREYQRNYYANMSSDKKVALLQQSAWQIFGFPLNDIVPSVLALHLHLPNLQSIFLHETNDLAHLASDDRTSCTMLTEFFRINQLNKDGPKYLYSEFFEHYVWNYGYRTSEPRHQRFSVGRIICANPTEGERYYLHLLLLHVRGPTSFNGLKTVDGEFYSSSRAAAQA